MIKLHTFFFFLQRLPYVGIERRGVDCSLLLVCLIVKKRSQKV
jgi:hypothetical protein